MIGPTGNIYCDFCGREQAKCGPLTANDRMNGRRHICADCALRSIASRLAGSENHATEQWQKGRPVPSGFPYQDASGRLSFLMPRDKAEEAPRYIDMGRELEGCPYREAQKCEMHNHPCDICWRTNLRTLPRARGLRDRYEAEDAERSEMSGKRKKPSANAAYHNRFHVRHR